MKSVLILFISILVYSEDSFFDQEYVDYSQEAQSSLVQDYPQDPPMDYFTEEPVEKPAFDSPYTDGLDSDYASELDPNLSGGSTEPTVADPIKTAEQEEIDYYNECTSKGFAPEQCCKTCVESYLSSWAQETCYDARDCQLRQLQNAEDAAREGSQRGPTNAEDSQSEGVMSGQ